MGAAIRGANFNPRTPCGVRRFAHPENTPFGIISIHAPLAGCDHARDLWLRHRDDFNPRTPCGVRLADDVQHHLRDAISIHAPLAGCDARRARHRVRPADFNPRTPCGVRRQRMIDAAGDGKYFNPRTPCGVRQQKRTKKCGTFAQIVQIQVLCVQKMHIRRLDGHIFFKKYALFRCELLGKSVRAFGSHS